MAAGLEWCAGGLVVDSGQCGVGSWSADEGMGVGVEAQLEPLDVEVDDAGEFTVGVSDVGADAVLGLTLLFEAFAQECFFAGHGSDEAAEVVGVGEAGSEHSVEWEVWSFFVQR